MTFNFGYIYPSFYQKINLIKYTEGDRTNRIFFFIISFYAFMHRTTIVQNKIISIICSCLFFVRLIFIGLVKGRFGQVGLTKTYLNHSMFISERKKIHSTLNCMQYNVLQSNFQFSISFFFYYFKKCIIKPVKIFIYIIIIN